MKIGFIGQAQGLSNSYWAPLSIPVITEEVVIRAFEWFDSVSAAEGSVKDNGYLIFEVMQQVKAIQTPHSNRTWSDWTNRQHSILHRFPEPRPPGLIPQVLGTSSFSEPAADPTPAKARTNWRESSSWKGMITSLRTTRSGNWTSSLIRLRTSTTRKR